MELRTIAGQHFIVIQSGKKETIQTPAEFATAETKSVDECLAHIAQLGEAVSAVQLRLEAELIDGADTSATRAEIAAINEEITGFRSDVADCHGRLKHAVDLIDQRIADATKRTDAARLAALTAPFESVLKEIA